ncbi:MAG TPA: efflux RND transporter periplasmic adaptor subunit [Acidobacteriota bacterium]|jgi:HlyD family secretion protein|nr:efflux RND transporter periplasmic adaptor subunit [Acidobacteriota bacterium]HRR25579.1 efflux RND transporter periplasmic adaptor subunit [Acidobacteriota bacterium]HRV07878.1 efflux RND transporter periplasmic adaptor subunit [Acidobacteriota bacterium]
MRDELKNLRIAQEKRAGTGGGGPWLWVSVILAVLLLGLGGWVFLSDGLERGQAPVAASADKPEAAADRPVVAAPPETRREVLVASGYVVAHHKHELGTKVMGRVQWIGVEKGDFVHKGQTLVKLEDGEYRAQLDEALAGLKAAEEYLAELEAGSRPQEIERAKAELERAKAEEALAELQFRRLESLLGSGVVSKEEVDDAETRLATARATVRAAEENVKLLEEGAREEEIRRARADVEHRRAGVEYARVMLDATEIRAPISGTVLRRIAEVGEMVTTSYAGTSGAKSAVVALADLTDLQVELDISQTDFNLISPDLDCVMTPEAYPDRKYSCEIDEISPEADRQKASIQVKVKVLEPDELLRPEMSARVTFLKKEEGQGD